MSVGTVTWKGLEWHHSLIWNLVKEIESAKKRHKSTQETKETGRLKIGAKQSRLHNLRFHLAKTRPTVWLQFRFTGLSLVKSNRFQFQKVLETQWRYTDLTVVFPMAFGTTCTVQNSHSSNAASFTDVHECVSCQAEFLQHNTTEES